MSILFFICGWIIYSNRDVPPAIIGGSIKHTVRESMVNTIGLLLMIPLGMDILRLCGLNQVLPYPLLVLYILLSNTLPLAAVILYYLTRYPRPAVGEPPYLANTDIPAERADLAQRIANRAYRPMLLLVFSLFVPLNLIAAPIAILLTSSAIHASKKVGFAVPQRKFAQVIRVLAILAVIAPTACLAALTFANLEAGDVLGDANLIGPTRIPTRRPTLSPEPTATVGYTSELTPYPTFQGNGTSRILFVSYFDDYNVSHIFSMKLNGSDVQQLTLDPDMNLDPAWSPDGTQVVFSSNRTGIYQLFVMNADGSEMRLLMDTEWRAFEPTWSPDGSQIAFTTDENIDGRINLEIYVVNIDGTELQNVTNNPEGDEHMPSWSPDGSQLVYFSDNTINIINIDGSGQRVFFNQDAASDPAWSPDGRWIAFIYKLSIALMPSNSTTADLRVIPLSKYEVSEFGWSPDSQSLLFRSADAFMGNGEPAILYVTNLDGTELQEIVLPFNNVSSPVWQQP